MLKVFDTLAKTKREFKSIHGKRVGFYHCGPTVYWVQHIGNMRGMALADLIRRSIEYLGYEVFFARNYTDVGHLTSDSDEGEDKMEKAAKREKISPQEIAQKYIDIFERDTKMLNIVEPTVVPVASQYVERMIVMIEILLEKGYAYTTPKAIYFDVSKVEDYTKLSGQKLSENKQGAGKGEVTDEGKRNPQDFALWFFKTGAHKNALQYWVSPFSSSEVENGQGIPGWHIECSAMALDLLGKTLDFHMGGIEHIPVHHTNEIAQSEAANAAKFVNYWLHNEHLTVDDRKMSKSEGTSYALSDVIKEGFDPLDLRYFFLGSHYRSKQNFTWKALTDARNARKKLIQRLRDFSDSTNPGKISVEYKKKFIDQVEDDFNIPKALAVVWEVVGSDISNSDKLATILDFDKVLGLSLLGALNLEIPEVAKNVLAEREQARADKNWKKADELRDKLMREFRVRVEDTANGQKVRLS